MTILVYWATLLLTLVTTKVLNSVNNKVIFVKIIYINKVAFSEYDCNTISGLAEEILPVCNTKQ